VVDEVTQVGETEQPTVALRRLRLDDLKPGMVITGKVKSVTKFGAFIDIGAELDGLVHISVLSDEYVKRVEDVVKVGDDVQVTVIEIDKNRKRVSLSMKDQSLEVDSNENVEPEEALPSAMEIAMRKALEGEKRHEHHKERHKRERVEQEDILARTLRLHREQKK
jgi:transcriptional accessory protein Tex/SPT6